VAMPIIVHVVASSIFYLTPFVPLSFGIFT